MVVLLLLLPVLILLLLLLLLLRLLLLLLPPLLLPLSQHLGVPPEGVIRGPLLPGNLTLTVSRSVFVLE